MYIYDCLYGKIEFGKKISRCMLTPEMQRLREVRLGNINSLCLTGSANINRYEHSIGTAYLASVNVHSNPDNFNKVDKTTFIYAALFHDLANGPFGHSYEYIMERQGFTPENSIRDVILGVTSGSHGKRVKLEPFYMEEPNEIGTILNRQEIEAVDAIVRGDNDACSKILSDVIDIDNIDNVYRMAYHMGIPVNTGIPVELAKGIVCKENKVLFKNFVQPYLYDWYETRSEVYKLLLYNPQDFAAKCMMADVLDIVLEEKPKEIKWHFTDYELIEALSDFNEEHFDDLFVPIRYDEEYDPQLIFRKLSNENTVREALNTFGVNVPPAAKIKIKTQEDRIVIAFYNTEYAFIEGRLCKKTRVSMNPSRTIKRLMRGDLFACVGIYVSQQINDCDMFFDYKRRREFELECDQYLKKVLGEDEYLIAFHAIVDKNKTNRQLEVDFVTGECLTIGRNTHEILIGAFLRNANYGLAKAGGLGEQKREKISKVVFEYLRSKGIESREHKLYSEVGCIGEREKR